MNTYTSTHPIMNTYTSIYTHIYVCMYACVVMNICISFVCTHRYLDIMCVYTCTVNDMDTRTFINLHTYLHTQS